MRVDKVVRDVYSHLGIEVGDQVLPLRIVLNELLDVSDRRFLEAQLSDSNLLVKSFELTIQSPDLIYQLPVDDFGQPVRVEFISETTGLNYANVQIVNHNNLHLFRSQSRNMACAFFGTPVSMEVTFSLSSPLTLKVWYEPDVIPDPRTLDTELPFRNIFIPMLASETALLCLPHLIGKIPMEKIQFLTQVLYRKLSEWEVLWQTWKNGQLNRSTVQKRKFNQRRRGSTAW